MSRAIKPLAGALVGAFSVFVVVLVALPPSTDAMEDDAARLVLAGSETTRIGSNEGATFIVGWERWSTAEFEDHRTLPVVHDQLVQHAQDLGWSIDRIGLAASGSTIEGSRAMTNVRITVGSQVQGGEPIEASLGRITVSRDEPRRAGLFWSSVLLGALGGAWLGHRV